MGQNKLQRTSEHNVAYVCDEHMFGALRGRLHSTTGRKPLHMLQPR